MSREFKGHGPIYGVSLFDSMPLGTGGMLQQMASERDLKDIIHKSSSGTRVAAAYEVLTDQVIKGNAAKAEMIAALTEARAWIPTGEGTPATRGAKCDFQSIALDMIDAALAKALESK